MRMIDAVAQALREMIEEGHLSGSEKSIQDGLALGLKEAREEGTCIESKVTSRIPLGQERRVIDQIKQELVVILAAERAKESDGAK